MTDSTLAAIFALTTAALAGPVGLIIRRGQRYGNAVTGVVIGLIVNLPLLIGATILLWEPGWWNLRAVMLFVALGLAGPLLGRVFMYQSIHYLGVSRAIPLIQVLPLTTAMAAFGLLGERPGPYVWAGTLLIVAGCVAITLKKKSDTSWDRRYLLFPLLCVAGFTAGNIIRKVGLNAIPSAVFGVTVTYASSLVFLFLFRRLIPPGHRPDLRWGKVWYFYGACGFCNTVTILLRFAATRYGDLTIVVPLFSMSSLFALLVSWLFLRDLERVTRTMVAGTLLVVLGGALITWRIF
ncbi:MAG: DMT family transporter [bacterium]